MREQFLQIMNYNINYELNDTAVNSVFSNWEKNKQRFVDKFGGLIYKSKEKVTIVRSEEELSIIWKDFIGDLSLYRHYRALVHADSLIKFLEFQGMNNFFKNEVIGTWTLESGKIVPGGMKISKALKFFVPDKEILHKLQTKYSMILQDVQLTGYLFASVHPLDYLSVSENNYNWHSCHALDGEYAAGNINYMTDDVTVVCYLADDKNQSIPRFADVEWNSKKWRNIMYVSKDEKMIVSSKGYPFKSTSLTNQCFDLLQEVFQGDWSASKEIENKNQAKELVVDKKPTLHFNDVLLSSTYRGFYREIPGRSQELIEIGEPFLCFSCGKEHAELSDEYTCRVCCNYEICSCCGEPVYEEEEYWFNDECYCEYCYYESVNECENCGELGYSDSHHVYWREDAEGYYCDECHEEIIKEWESDGDY